MRVLGISAFYHDSAAALVDDGAIVAAAQEERFTRKKHDPGFPKHAVEFCLRHGGVGIGDVDLIAFYDKPLLKFERLLETYLAFAPRGFKSFSMAIPVWLREKLFLKDLLAGELAALGAEKKALEPKMVFSEHHLSHAASAFLSEPNAANSLANKSFKNSFSRSQMGMAIEKLLKPRGAKARYVSSSRSNFSSGLS